MTLCPNCHAEATEGAMLEKEQRELKAHPYNIEKGFVEGKLKFNQKTPVVNIGTCQILGETDFFLVDGESLLSLSVNHGSLELSLNLYDKEDHQVVVIKDNEWISGDPLPWDLESRFQWLRIRRKLRDIELEIDASKTPIDLRADLWRKKQNFLLKPREILFNGVVQNTGFRDLCLVGLQLEANTNKKTFSFGPDPRYGSGSIVSHKDVKERVKQGLLAWKKLVCEHDFETVRDRKRYQVLICHKCGKKEKIWK